MFQQKIRAQRRGRYVTGVAKDWSQDYIFQIQVIQWETRPKRRARETSVSWEKSVSSKCDSWISGSSAHPLDFVNWIELYRDAISLLSIPLRRWSWLASETLVRHVWAICFSASHILTLMEKECHSILCLATSMVLVSVLLSGIRQLSAPPSQTAHPQVYPACSCPHHIKSLPLWISQVYQLIEER